MEKNSALQIDIIGNRYNIDSSLHLLPIDKDLPIIQVSGLDIAIEHQWERFGYYDLINKCLYSPPEDLRELPGNVVAFSIPSDRELLEAMHNTLVIYAEIVDLNKSGLKAEVDENKVDSIDSVRERNDKELSPGLNQGSKEEQKQPPKKKRGKQL